MISHNGLRHLALRVADVERAKEFYLHVFGMQVVWQPDADEVYLSSGWDNLALHRRREPDGAGSGQRVEARASSLDHLGFVVANVAEVEAGYAWAQRNSLEIVRPLRHHRDGAVSFYLRDPDGNVIQVLYEPSISARKLVDTKA